MHFASDLPRPCFIVGCPRSGTTLLSVLLDRHPALSILPETAFYDEMAPHLYRARDLRKLLTDWPRLAELGLDVDAVLQKCGPVPTPRGLLTALLQLYAQRMGKPRVGEKTPTHLQHVSAIMNDFPRAQVICLVRNGRDAALSLRGMPWFDGDLGAAAQAWLRAARQLHFFRRTYPRRLLVVRYEDLVADPAATLVPLMSFLGLEFQSTQLDPTTLTAVVLPRSLEWKGQALGVIDGTGGHRRADATPADNQFLNDVLRDELIQLNYAAG